MGHQNVGYRGWLVHLVSALHRRRQTGLFFGHEPTPPSSPLIFLRSQSLVYLNGTLKPCSLLCHETYIRQTFAVSNQSSLLLRHLTSEENFFCSSQIFKHCSIADVIRFSWWRRAKRESGKICDFLFSHHLIANKRNGKVFILFSWMDVLWMILFVSGKS